MGFIMLCFSAFSIQNSVYTLPDRNAMRKPNASRVSFRARIFRAAVGVKGVEEAHPVLAPTQAAAKLF